jgi:1-acyl-sn-glycerol-3-phosphate acyltransferase
MTGLRGAWRILRALGHALAGWRTIAFDFPRLSPAERALCVQEWSARMLEVFGIELRVLGTPPATGPLLLVANHISWLDILVMHAARHCRFVAKSDVKRWPLVGTLATGGGTLYIERESRRDAMRVVHHMADALRAGEILAVFPEGTTGDGRELLPFHANLIQAAISANAPVQPVALSFIDAATGAPSFAASYVGDETMLGSMWRTVTGPGMAAVIAFGEPQAPESRERRAWAGQLQAAVEELRARR